MLEDDRRKEKLLVNYQRQLTKLLLHYQSIVNVSQHTLLFVLQMKTRTALRLLNPIRRTILVRGLRQAGLLDEAWKKEKSPLYRVNVSGVHFGQPPSHNFSNFLTKYDYLDIERADVRYASFRSVHFTQPPNFIFSMLDFTDWSYTKFSHMSFRGNMTMNNAIFTKSNLESVTFENIPMNQVSFRHNIQCKYCTFNRTSLLGAGLDNSTMEHSDFLFTSMADANMSKGFFFGSTFHNVILDRVDLSGADIGACKFRQVSMVNCTMTGAILQNAQFDNVNNRGCKGWPSG
jgi:uncharacterized protein YjbI with pentapeptide repeats